MSRLLLAVLVMTAVTILTRAAPFLFFSRRKPPAFLGFLQIYAPPVIMTLLVLGALKDVPFGQTPYGIPALSGVALSAALHLWKRNVLLSIAGATTLYMILIRIL
ncbi:MAG: AzlD domain-containing protein [Spirochaetota bacterium]